MAPAVVPAVSGRLLRFDGALQHAAKARRRLAELEASTKGDDDVAEPEEMIRSVVLFNTGVSADLLRETAPGRGTASVLTTCAAHLGMRGKSELVTPLGGRQTGVMRLAALRRNAAGLRSAESIEVPVNHDARRAAALTRTIRRRLCPRAAQVHEAHEGRVVPATVSYPPLGFMSQRRLAADMAPLIEVVRCMACAWRMPASVKCFAAKTACGVSGQLGLRRRNVRVLKVGLRCSACASR